MTATEAIEALQALLGINDEFDDAISFAVYTIEQQEKGDSV